MMTSRSEQALEPAAVPGQGSDDESWAAPRAQSSFDEAALIAQCEQWVGCESPTRDADAVNTMLSIVAKSFAQAPVTLIRLPGRDGLADTLKVCGGPETGEKPILLLSHVDTVHPMGTIDRDLPLRREQDKLFGPGIYDMKACAMVAAEAFKTVARDGALRRPVVFLFTPDEEIGSPTSRDIIEHEARRSAFVLVTEPARTGGRIVTARKGVGRFEVLIEGRPSHAGSAHEKGRSAIREAARQILAIEAMTDYSRGVTTTVATVSGGTAANVIPQFAQFSVDLRVTTVADGLLFEQAILNLRPDDPDVRITVTGGMNRPPMEKSEAINALFQRARRVAARLGQTLDDVPMVGGGSDGNFTAALGVATLDGLGVEGDGAHTLTEHILIPSLVPRAKLMSGLLREL
jgi:glutamate carboxypeptidase